MSKAKGQEKQMAKGSEGSETLGALVSLTSTIPFSPLRLLLFVLVALALCSGKQYWPENSLPSGARQ